MELFEMLRDEMFEIDMNDDGLLNEMAGLLMSTGGCGYQSTCGCCCSS